MVTLLPTLTGGGQVVNAMMFQHSIPPTVGELPYLATFCCQGTFLKVAYVVVPLIKKVNDKREKIPPNLAKYEFITEGFT